MWTPIQLQALQEYIAASEAVMDDDLLRLWKLVRVVPEKWQLHPWGDEGGGFWVVAIFGRQVLWYNDIEEGFNFSTYSAIGSIDEYGCNQDDLHRAVNLLQHYLRTGEIWGRFGPPQPVPSSD